MQSQNDIEHPTRKKEAPSFKVEEFTKEPVHIHNANVFFPDWNNRPIDQPAVLSLNCVPVLSHQNTTAIIAAPGYGKSSLCEAVAANYLNPDADCLGWEVHEDCTGIIVIDNERTKTDVWKSFERMAIRAGIRAGSTIDKVKIAGLRSVPRLEERLKTIETLLKDNPCGLLILDGAGDLVTDTNDLPQANDCRIFLREMTFRYNLSILTTLHPNQGSFKPRGHLGSEICREAECVLIAKTYQGNCRMITSDFESGKNRNSSKANAYYTWDENKHMFISVLIEDVPAMKQKAKEVSNKAHCEKLALQVLPDFDYISYTDLVKAIMHVTSLKESTAKTRITEMVNFRIAEKRKDGLYSSYW